MRRVFSLLAALTCSSSMVVAAATPDWTVVASGLNNPRGLDFAPNGALYIAEGGTGGDGPTIRRGESTLHFGLSGSITRVFKGVQERIVTGLPSLAEEGGFAASGPSSVDFQSLGHALVTIGLGTSPATRDTVLGAAGADLGVLFQMSANGHLKRVADIAAFERTDPDGSGPDSNPNGVLSATAGGAYVADAGGNSLVYVDATGKISLVAIFPNRTVATPAGLPQPPFPPQLSMQSVPTNVVRGPDGALYVSELTGFPFPAGAARIYRVVPGAAPTVYATGFTNIIDLEFDSRGNLYVLEIDKNGLAVPDVTGRLARISANGGAVVTIASTGLVMPGGMTIGPDGAIYVSNYSTSPGGGQVVRIEPGL